MVDVKVRESDVRDRAPLRSELGQPARGARPAIDQKTKLPRIQQVCGAASGAGERDGARAQRGESHDHCPRKRIFFVVRTPSASKAAM